MNWILTSVFLVIIVSMYYVFGSVVLQFLDYENKKYTHKIIAGFISVNFIQWCIGFPAQLFHLNWNIYFWSLLLVYVVVSIFIIRKYVTINKCNSISKLKEKIKKHIGNYWFIYILTLLFTFFSVTSQLPYLEMNYDDHYYIGRIVQEIGANQLAVENYFTGSISGISFDRILTTYEIGYSFWSELFNITAPFFARFSMVVLNYYLIFIALHTVSGLIIKKQKLIQFGILGIVFLIIPAGYLWHNGYTLMYDGWQFNTAVWYGSSIVRMAGIPILLLLIPIFEKNKVKGILSYIIVSITMLSFSAITIPMVILLTLAFLLVYLLFEAYKNPDIVVKIISILLLIAMVIVVVFIDNIDLNTSEFIKKVNQGVQTFVTDNQYRLENSSIFIPTAILSVFSVLFIKKDKRIILLTVLIALIGFFIPSILKFLHFGAMGYFFVVARIFTSMQIMLIVLSSSFLVALAIQISSKYSKFIVSTIVIVITIVTINFQLNNLQEYKKITFLGSGISQSGYSVRRLLNNPYMVPIIYEDLGNYFAKNETERIRIIAPEIINYENGMLNLSSGLVMSANNIEVCTTPYTGCDQINEDQTSRTIISEFLNGDLSKYTELKTIMTQYGIEMLLTDKQEVLNFLIDNGGILELTSESLKGEKLYLIKV